MSSRELCFLSVSELAEKTKAQEISPRETVEAHLAQIDELNPELNAFITVCHEEAMSAAARAEEEISGGQYRGPLHGIPIGVKDIIDTEGIRTTQGSSFYSQNVPEKDAECVRRLKEAGAIVIGKCNTHEFACGASTKNPHYGACANPWDTSRIPAGSSGGSGAAVAARMCPAALGSDTGGSIRGPAAICGVNGLKPTYGRVSLTGVYPNATSLDHIGPFARSSRDCALILQGMAGYDPADCASIDMPVPDFSAEIGGDVKGLRLVLCPDLVQIEIDKSVENAFNEAVEVLRGLGAKIDTVACSFADDLNNERLPIADAELLAVHRENIDNHPEKYGDDVRARIENARNTTLAMYFEALKKKVILIREMEALFAPYDGLLLPAYSCIGAPIDTVMATINGKQIPFLGASRPLTGPHNFTGFPSHVVPTGLSPKENMPV
ncbi:MAG: amidase, partial [Nitrospinaceae bacterium]|nr:amidase [Nitrospinaceae bacterium]